MTAFRLRVRVAPVRATVKGSARLQSERRIAGTEKTGCAPYQRPVRLEPLATSRPGRLSDRISLYPNVGSGSFRCFRWDCVERKNDR